MAERVSFLLLVACLAVALPAVAEEQELNCYGEALLGARGMAVLSLCALQTRFALAGRGLSLPSVPAPFSDRPRPCPLQTDLSRACCWMAAWTTAAASRPWRKRRITVTRLVLRAEASQSLVSPRTGCCSRCVHRLCPLLPSKLASPDLYP